MFRFGARGDWQGARFREEGTVLVGRCNGQSNAEEGAVAEGALRFDLAAMQIDDPAGDREAEAGAAGFTGARLIGTVEAFEDVREVFFGDADAGVADFDARMAGSIRKAQGNLAAGGRVLHGVFENDQQETRERGMIRGNSHRTCGEFTGDLDSLARRQNAGFLGNPLELGDEINVAEMKISGTGVGAG